VKTYAGIGSRETPPDICEKMTKIANYLNTLDFTLRSGGADGADLAFEAGAGNKKEIYLPWKGFNGSDSPLYLPENMWDMSGVFRSPIDFARVFHPAWDNLSEGGQRMMIRNGFQIMGQTLDNPVKFVVCWTKDGKESGGTGQAMRIAHRYCADIYNLKIDGEIDRLREYLKRTTE